MKIAALYKTFDGPEFAVASLESIYDFCEKIVFVNSDTSWSGEKGNKVFPVINKWVQQNDTSNKVWQINGDWNSQEEQYQKGFDFIKSVYPECSHILIIDTDEVWRCDDLNKLLQALKEDNGEHDRFTCRMRTYVKSPFYRVTPTEPCCPTIIVKNGLPYVGIRGDGLEKRKHLENVFFDHFCYVRKDLSSIKGKFKTSEIGDKNPSHNWIDWKINKWDNIPNAQNCHPTLNREYCWHSFEVITKDQLPVTVQKMKELDNDWAK